MTTFDYELCMKRDGGKAKWGGRTVTVLGDSNANVGSELRFHPCVDDTGTYHALPTFILRNLTPPNPELKPVDVVWRGNDPVEVYAVASGESVALELRRITVDPNALTPDELAEHGIHVRWCLKYRSRWQWFRGDYGHGEYDTHAAACLAATEWLRKEGVIE